MQGSDIHPFSLDDSVPPEIGTSAPELSLTDINGNHVTLSDFHGSPVVLTFFGDDWDPARAEHLARYDELLRDLLRPAVATSPDKPIFKISGQGTYCKATFTDSDEMGIPLLVARKSDVALARRFGVEGQQGVFVIGGNGTIHWKFVAPYGVYPKPDAVRDALRIASGVGEEAITDKKSGAIGRREFLATSLAAAFILALQPFSPPASRADVLVSPLGQPQDNASVAMGTVPVTLNINGKTQTLNLEPRVTLLDALREYIGLTGTKKGCDHGQCGACTVHVAGRRINSCLTLAVMVQNQPINTIEGLAMGDRLHPMQEAFIKHDGFQCGYCTPGQIMSAVALIQEGHAKSSDDVRELMSGNICRCGAYPNIVAAVEEMRNGGTATAQIGKENHATV